MAREVGLTQTAVSQMWRAFGLQSHRQQTWKLSKDPQFVAKVRDVVGLYLIPPERAVVLSVDERSTRSSDRASAPNPCAQILRAHRSGCQRVGDPEPL